MISIEDLTPRDFDLVAGWLSRPEVNRWLTGEWRNRTVDGTTLAIAVRNRRNRLFLVRCGEEAAGLAALADIDAADRTGMVWYVLGEPRFAGQGVTSEAVKQVARTAFGPLGLQSIYAWIMEDNVASRRVLEKAGFREAGRLRHATCSDGRQVDRVYFDLVCADAADR